ncbi:MAG: 16S rRNA (guanine(966)-N(2))-methyltransferase RsmD [Betaproteobacteria bacterium]
MSTHELRIIGGLWKRSKIKVLEREGLRPTPDRVRETLFNWLGQDLTGLSCVDVFAGTGILGLESASRGAKSVQLFELDKALCQAIELHIQRFKAQGLVLKKTDGVQGLIHLPKASLDVVFIDPPFQSELFAPAMKAATGALKASGLMYVESPQKLAPDVLMGLGLECLKYLKAGQVHAHLLNRIKPDG